MHTAYYKDPRDQLDTKVKETLASAATRLAHIAGEYIFAAYVQPPDVEFKPPGPGGAPNSNPVSATDRAVERLVSEWLAAEFPEHVIIGEEHGVSAGRPGGPMGQQSPFTWVIDPVDGTTNFVNGLPLFAASIGVLYRGWPVAGAIWCSCSHTFAPGIYHACAGGPLQFAGAVLRRRARGDWRGLASEPGRAPTYGALWDTRVLGCSTIEFAFVAAGLLSFAYIARPKLWDVAAGLVLVQAAGCHAVVPDPAGWRTLLYFGTSEDDATALSRWSEPVLLGDELALERARSVRSGGA
ncbi:MAG TPA: inositol monophosphatase family protein [Acidobacteriaceae bacterium]|nr:inositol monophosphatase family protein [Acidobacteriaceae bacterium]